MMKVTRDGGTITIVVDANTTVTRPATEEDLLRFPEIFTDDPVDYSAMERDELKALLTQRGLQFGDKNKTSRLIKLLEDGEAEEEEDDVS